MTRISIQSAAVLGKRKEITIDLPNVYDGAHLELVLDAFNIGPGHAEDFYVSCNGHVVEENDVLSSENVYRLTGRLCGGKGGFGSMLRAIGAQIEKTTSREACRDLSGRRMRDVNNEKKLKEWVSKQSDREKEKAERRRERRERQKNQPAHKFADRQYDEQKAAVLENLEEALQTGLNRTSAVPLDGNRKRKSEDGDRDALKKRAAEWLGFDPDELSDLGSSSDEEPSAVPYQSYSEINSEPTSGNSGNNSGNNSESNLSTAVQFSDNDSKASSEWETPDQFMDTEQEPVHSDMLLDRLGDPSETGSIVSDRGECSKSDAGSIRSERGECSKSDAGSIRSERGECSKSDAGSIVSELESVRSSQSGKPSENGLPMEVKEENPPLVLEEYDCATDLHALGLERLKCELMSRGLKCGGTIEQRAERLFSVKGLRPDQYNPSIVSKGGKSKSSQR